MEDANNNTENEESRDFYNSIDMSIHPINYSELMPSKTNNQSELKDVLSLVKKINDKKSYYCEHCDKFPRVNSEDDNNLKVRCVNKDCGNDFDTMLNNRKTLEKKEEEELKKKYGCKKHNNKQFAFFCTKCENLCEDCYKSHNNQGHSDKDKQFDFKKLDEEIKVKETYINEFFYKYGIFDQNEKKEMESKVNDNFTIVIRKEVIKDNSKYLKIKDLYYIILYNKENFPNYTHYLNIEEIYYFLLDKLEIVYEYKFLSEKEKANRKINIFGEKFVENNKNNCRLVINGEKLDLCDKLDLCEKYGYDEQEESELNILLIKEKSIENMSEMFSLCHCLREVKVKNQWEMDNTTDINSMFFECENLKHFKASQWPTFKVKNFSKMFYNCKSLKEISERDGTFDTSNVENLKEMFYGCELLKKLVGISEWKTDNVIDVSSMFYNCKQLEKINLSKWILQKVKYLNKMFEGCESLKTITFNKKIDSSEIIRMDYMFAGCKNLDELSGLSSFNTGNVMFMNNMFQNCSSLKRLDLSGWKTEKLLDMVSMFENCSNLEEIKGLSGFNTKEVILMNDLFQNCVKIKKFDDIFNWETKDVQSFNKMFDGCNKEIKKPPWYQENQ